MAGQRVVRERSCSKWLLTITMIVIVVSTALSAAAAGPSVEDLFSGVTTLIAPYSKTPSVSIDGVITSGEFDSNVTWTTPDTATSISVLHDNDSLFVGINGGDWSWVAIGISSDSAATMGFILIAKVGSSYGVEERRVTSVGDTMEFQPVGGPGAVKEFALRSEGGKTTAELRLSLEASFWSLEPGVVYPAVVATNLTAPAGIPTTASGSQVHFLGGYLLRQEDSVRNVNELLNGKVDPVPSLVAVGILSIGIVAIFAEFVVRRRKQ